MKKNIFWFLLFLLASCTKLKEEDLIGFDISEGQTNWLKKVVKTYPEQPAYVKLHSVFFTSEDTGFVAGQNTSMSGGGPQPIFFRTTDGGETWSSIFVPVAVGATVVDIHFASPSVGYALVESATLERLKTTDGGMTWGYASIPFSTYETSSSCFITADKGFFVTQSGIFCTTDGALTYTPFNKTFPGFYNYTGMDFPTSNTGYAITLNGIVVKSVDSGSTWDSIYRYPGKQFNAVNFTDSLTGYVGTSTGDILKTVDGGYTWNLLSAPTTSDDNITDVKFFGSSVGFASISIASGPSQDKGRILKTTDGGITWTVNYHSQIMSFSSLSVANSNTWFSTGGIDAYLTDVISSYLLKTTTQGN